MKERKEVIVVGSGCTGAMAAQTLLERGFRVCMLDVGCTGDPSLVPPDENFNSIRSTRRDQAKYLLGDDPASIWENAIQTGAHLTPPRKHLLSNVKSLLPAVHDNFYPMESLAYGGLGAGWGLGCCVFSNFETAKAGLPDSISGNYKRVAGRIGICGMKDDATPYTWDGLEFINPPLELDKNAASLFNSYRKKKLSVNRDGFFMGRPALALTTTEGDVGREYAYRDMDFYDDHGLSAWRPWITVDQLKKDPNFEYRDKILVTHFDEDSEGVQVKAQRISDGSSLEFVCGKLILASGTIGTARIVLRSLSGFDQILPVLCNPYVYVPSLQWSMIGRDPGSKNVGFAQLSLFYDPEKRNEAVSMASVYSYNELMMFRLIRQAPLAYRDAKKLFDSVLPAMTIFGIHIPDSTGKGKELSMELCKESPTGDQLHLRFVPDDLEIKNMRDIISKFKRTIRKLGCFPLRVVDPGMGSSIHYAGTLPFSKIEKPFHLSGNGRLYGTNHIFIADGSGFTYLPAKGLTLSLMAWADHVAQHIPRA